jgi:diguanylate cyclase (GGDEF)-like protein
MSNQSAGLLLAALIWASGGWAGASHASVAPIEAESPAEPRFESVGVGAIPRGVVSAVAQDRAGFLWLGTGDGLVRYDGHRFRPQGRIGENGTTQSLGFVRTLLPTRDGRLWIGTESDGLASYDPLSERIRLHPIGTTPGGPALTVRALAEARDGTLWVGSMGDGLTHFDPATERVTTHRHADQAGSLPDDRVQSLLIDRQGTLWIGTWQGLSRRVAGSDRFEPVFSDPAEAASLAGQIVLSLLEASDGRIWVGTQQGRLAVIDPHTAQGLLLDPGPGKHPADQQGAVFSLTEAPGGPVWVGRAAGLAWHDVGSGQLLRHLQHDPRKASSLASNEVRSLLRDQAGWIWLGGYGLGLQRHNPGNRSIWVRGADTQPGSLFEDANVSSVLPLDNGELWIGTPTAGVAVMNAQLRITGSIRPQARQPSRIDAMVQAGDGSVWLGSDSGLHQFSRQRRRLRTVQHGAGTTQRLLSAGDGALWIGTQDGLYVLRPGAPSPTRVLQQGGQPLGGDVYAIAEGADRALWIGTDKGLFRLALGLAELVPVAMQAGAGLGNAAVIGLLIDRQQVLWVDTAVAGLHRLRHWDGQTAGFDAISARHGVVGRPFGVNLLEDGRGRIWTQQFVYDPATDQLTTLSTADGVDFGTGWFRSYGKTADGRMLFGGSKGLLVVRPERFDRSADAPSVVVSDLRLDGQHRPAGQALGGLQLAPGNRGFSIEFAAIDYSEPGRNRYAYQLQGVDPDWIDTGAEFRVASYGNLSPGHYRLRVRATNRSGVWSPHELTIDVQVQPAWWQSGWFRLMALAALAAAIYGVVQLRTRYLRHRQLALEHKVSERTAELQTLTLTLAQRSAELEAASLSDPLTGLRNRRFLSQHIEREVALSVRRHADHQLHGQPLADDADLIFFLIDIDHFKQVNDQHGHAAGDAVLKQVCERLRQVFRDSDYLVRWGGEEFLIVAIGTSRSHAAELAERARASVAQPPFVLDDGTPLHKTCSIGFACFPPDPAHAKALDWSSVINLADAALYAVKHNSRDGWLGVVNAHADSDESLSEWARRPLAQWQASGLLEMAGSGPGTLATQEAIVKEGRPVA